MLAFVLFVQPAKNEKRKTENRHFNHQIVLERKTEIRIADDANCFSVPKLDF